MFTDKYNQLLKLMMKKGIILELLLDEDNNVLVNVNTGAKSHAHLLLRDDGSIKVLMRYGYEDLIYNTDTQPVEDTLKELSYIVRGCMCGRDYCSQAWLDIMVENGIVEKVVETKVTYR